MQYHFSGFTFDADTFELSRASGETIVLQPRALELLYFLLRQPRSLARKEDILREVWGGVAVSSGALSLQVFKLREALGDNETPNRLIQTIKRQGLRLDADVSVSGAGHGIELDPEAVTLAEPSERAGLKSDLIGNQPTIAVLKFAQDSSDDDLQGLARAIPTDIITELARFQLLRVTSSSSSFLLSEDTASPVIVRSALGTDYCLGGQVSRAGDNYAIFTELIDTSTQAIVWAEQFEVEPRDIHSVRAEIVSRVVSWVQDKVPQNEAQPIQFYEPESLTAWQAFHVGTSLIYRRGSENIRRAQKYLERSVTIDPTFSRAWSGLAHTNLIEVVNRPFDASQGAKRRLMRFAEKAVEANQDDPSANLWLGRAMSTTKADGDAAVWIERAIELAPSYALAHQQLGATHVYQNNNSRAVDHASASLMLNPQGPERYANYTVIALAQLKTGSYHTAIEWSKKAGKAPYDNLHILLSALFTNHWTGDMTEAARIADRIKSAFPGVTQAKIFKLDTLAGEFSGLAAGIFTAHGIK